jgi:hypothetical protein
MISHLAAKPWQLFCRLALRQPLRGGEFACDYARFEETPFHRIARECEGGQKVFMRVVVLSALKLKLAKRSEVERISGEAFWIGDRMNRFQSSLRTRALTDGNGPVKRYDGRWTDGH